MKRIICYIIFIIQIIIGQAQIITVSSFKLLDTDLTANTAGTMEVDQNGETAALIKVVTTQTGFTFDGGVLGIVKTVQKPSEIWVYVPKGLKKITISHPHLGILRDYYLNLPIEAARTYEMILVSGEVQTVVKHTTNNQYLVIKVTPADAVVELGNEILPTSNGVAQKFVKLGTYDYRVQAQDYHTTAGKVTVDDPNNKKVLEVNLQPAFGWIEISPHDEYNGAQVYIDNKLEGTIPLKSRSLSSGSHSLKIVKDLYMPFSKTVDVKDNETTIVSPALTANYSELTISVGNDADIYINEEKKGSGKWIGKLASGSYIVEARKEGYRSSAQTIQVSTLQPKQSIILTDPSPIYGELNITSNPIMAEVYIDGKLYGQTPLYEPNFIIGSHYLSIRYNGHEDYNKNILIKEGEPFTIDVNLVEKRQESKEISSAPEYTVKIKTAPYKTALRIDGKILGIYNSSITIQEKVKKGKHMIEVLDATTYQWKQKYIKEINIIQEDQLIEL